MLPHLRCPKCFATPFASLQPVSDAGVSVLTCSTCGTDFASFRGVPILCAFDHTDVQTVAEMLAVRQRLTGLYDEAERVEPEMVFGSLLKRWAGNAPDQEAPWWMETRQIELILVQAMLQGVPLEGALTLDVGAGFGTDSAYYASRGAQIVALEPNFGMLSEGARTYGRFTWIGGSADALPFADESMDVVVSNASLHHHLNVEISLDEMLRVLKPGGWMITACDSVKASQQESVEVDHLMWDTDPSVLSGINEQILRMDVLLNKLMSHGDGIAGEVYLREGSGEYVRWTFAQAAEIIKQRPKLWAIMGMRVQKLRSLRTPEHRMRQGRVATPALARAVLEDADRAAGYHLLGALLSKEDTRKALPLAEVNRFLQLNGWRWPLASVSGQTGPEWRLIYRRGRLFMQPEAATQSIVAVFAVPAVDKQQRASVSLCINGSVVHTGEFPRGQIQHWSCPIPALSKEVPCSIVLELDAEADAHGTDYVAAASHIAVRRLELGTEPARGCSASGLFQRSSFSALQVENILTSSICVAVGSLVGSGLDTLGRLRQLGIHVSVVCDDATWPFYAPQYGDARSAGAALFATGMSLDEAQKTGCTWFLHQGWAQSLTAADVFAQQLAPAVPKAEAQLRKELDKTKRKLEEARSKLADARSKAKARASGSNAADHGRRSLWDKLFRRSGR